jgi:type IV secretion system protein VirB6
MRVFRVLFLLCWSLAYLKYSYGGCGGGEFSKSKNVERVIQTADGAKVEESANIFKCQSSYKDTNYRIGWSNQCAIPTGGAKYTENTNKSCVVNPQFFKMIANQLTTLGIASSMQNNFCSAVMGDWQLEGGIIKHMFLDQCDASKCNGVSNPEEKESCLRLGEADDVKKRLCESNLLKGLVKNTPTSSISPDAFKEWIPFNSIKTQLDDYVGGSDTLCDGIPNFDKPVLDDKGKPVIVTEGTTTHQLYCPLTRCDIPTEDMKVKYIDTKDARAQAVAIGTAATSGMLLASGIGAMAAPVVALLGSIASFVMYMIGEQEYPVTLRSGEQRGVALWGIVKLRADESGDMLCTSMLFTTGWTRVACKFKTPSVIPFIKPDDCRIQQTSCWDSKNLMSQAIIPLTSRMMQCVTELIDFTFMKSCCDGKENPIFAFQRNMKSTVGVALVLYIIFFGLKILVGGEMPKRSELFIFAIQIGLVTWCAVGVVPGKNDCSAVGTDEYGIERNGLQFVYTLTRSATQTFSNMFITSDNTADQDELCTYNPTDSNYKKDGKDYGYLALWDTIDCRIGYYLGFLVPTEFGLKTSQLPLGGGLLPGIFTYIWGMLFSFDIVMLFFTLVFAIMLLSITVYLVQMYIISMIAIAILIFVGPIFVPMSLFAKTKEYFNGWCNLLIAYSIQPAIVVAFIALMITVFDYSVYPKGDANNIGCTFKRHPEISSSTTKDKPFWILQRDDKGDVGPECKLGLGYLFASSLPGELMEPSTFLGIFPVFKLANSAYHIVMMYDKLILCAFFAFLFYTFNSQLSSFAAELSQATNIGDLTVGANAVNDTAKAAVEMALDFASKGGYSKAKTVASRAGGAVDSASGGVDVAAAAPTNKKDGVQVSGKSKDDASGIQASSSAAPVSKGGVPPAAPKGGAPPVAAPR